MNNLSSILTTLLGLTGLLAFVGAVVRGKSKDVFNRTLQEGNEELRAQIGDKNNQISDLESKMKIISAQVEAADTARKVAESLAQSRPAFEQLGEQMLRQHKQLLQAIGRQTTQLTKLAEVITKGQK